MKWVVLGLAVAVAAAFVFARGGAAKGYEKRAMTVAEMTASGGLIVDIFIGKSNPEITLCFTFKNKKNKQRCYKKNTLQSHSLSPFVMNKVNPILVIDQFTGEFLPFPCILWDR